MRSAVFIAFIFISLPAGAARGSGSFSPKATSALRTYAQCMLGNAEQYSEHRGSPEVLAEELDEHCRPKYRLMKSLVRRDIAKHFHGRRRVDAGVRAQMIAEQQRKRFKRSVVAEISDLRYSAN